MEQGPASVENAVSILFHFKNSESSIKKLFQFVMDNLIPISEADSNLAPLLASLATLHQLIPLRNPAVLSKEHEITRFLITLIKINSSTDKTGPQFEEWVSNEDLDDEGKAKVPVFAVESRSIPH